MAKIPVHESRRLLVPLETAVDAVLDLDSEQGGLLAFGLIVEAEIEAEPQPGLVIVVQRRGTEGSERRKFELPILAAAFIRYCWKCRIPLPRHGTKRIEVTPEGFVFTIEGTVEVVRRHGALPKRGPPSGRDSLAEASSPASEAPPRGESSLEPARRETDAPAEAVAG